ncbi:pollen-specific protein SF21-like [Iris pallida]|uniref:Pollen-specific protein SF21-like n=1 Tax=Iris pallida TaxID=29817 RepID=A0AAX6GDF6_IRIPA|nr:pollen-specific protein SF21-like [Iris pallida]
MMLLAEVDLTILLSLYRLYCGVGWTWPTYSCPYIRVRVVTVLLV